MPLLGTKHNRGQPDSRYQEVIYRKTGALVWASHWLRGPARFLPGEEHGSLPRDLGQGPDERLALVTQDEGLDRWYLGMTRIPVPKAAEALGIQFAQAL